MKHLSSLNRKTISIVIAPFLVGLLVSCSGGDFSGANGAGSSKDAKKNGAPGSDANGKDKTAAGPDSESGPSDGSNPPGPEAGGGSLPDGSQLISSDGGISVGKFPFSGPDQTLMFRGTRGANLKTMVVGIYLNSSDQQKLTQSQGMLVVSGLRTGSTINDWGYKVKAMSPAPTSDNITQRMYMCNSNEVLIGQPDARVDVKEGDTDPNWNNQYLCSALSPGFTISDVKEQQLLHGLNLNVNCQDEYVLIGYNCGSCMPNKSSATLKCGKIKKP